MEIMDQPVNKVVMESQVLQDLKVNKDQEDHTE